MNELSGNMGGNVRMKKYAFKMIDFHKGEQNERM